MRPPYICVCAAIFVAAASNSCGDDNSDSDANGESAGAPDSAAGATETGFSGTAGTLQAGESAGGSSGRGGQAGQGGQTEVSAGEPAVSAGGGAGEGGAGEAGLGGSAGLAPAGGEAGAAESSGAAAGAEASAGAAGAAVDLSGPIVIAEDQQGPTGIAIDATRVYWANQDAGTIVACPLTGCGRAAPTLLASDDAVLRDIAVDEDNLYFVDLPIDGEGRVLSCPISGCVDDPVVLLDLMDVHVANGVHVAGDTFYYGAWPEFGSCPTSGCSTEEQVRFSGAPVVSLDSDEQFLYTARYGWREIRRCNLPDCSDEVVLVSDVVPLSVAVDDTHVYVADYDYFDSFGSDVRQIVRCPLSGCGDQMPELVQSGDISPYAIEVDAERLYYTNYEQGSVVSVPK